MTAQDVEPESTEALASWLAGHCQALAGGDRVPGPSIGDHHNWMIGYDVGIQDRQQSDVDSSTPLEE